MKKSIIYLFAGTLLLSSCKDDEKDKESCSKPFNFSSGAVVINEGAFNGTGSLSHIDLTTNEVRNFIYEDANCDVPAGSVVQSFAINGEKGYVVANGSGEVQVVNLSTFKQEKTILLSYPRYIAFEGEKGFISNGTSEGKVFVINSLNAVTDTIQVATGPEGIFASGGKILVGCTGHWNGDLFTTMVDSVVAIINPSDLSVTNVNTWDKPTDFVEDKNGDVWVSCAGNGQYDNGADKAPAFVKLNVENGVAKDTLIIGEVGESISKITINESGDIIYYYKGDGVYRVGINGDYINEEVLIPGNFYGVEVDPASGNILTFDAKGFSSDGVVGRYSADGDSITHYSVGVAPNGALIK